MMYFIKNAKIPVSKVIGCNCNGVQQYELFKDLSDKGFILYGNADYHPMQFTMNPMAYPLIPPEILATLDTQALSGTLVLVNENNLSIEDMYLYLKVYMRTYDEANVCNYFGELFTAIKNPCVIAVRK